MLEAFMGLLFVWLFVLSALVVFLSQSQKRHSESLDTHGRAWLALDKLYRDRPKQLAEQEKRLEESMVVVTRIVFDLIGELRSLRLRDDAGSVWSVETHGHGRSAPTDRYFAYRGIPIAHVRKLANVVTPVTYPHSLRECCADDRPGDCPSWSAIGELCRELRAADKLRYVQPDILGEQ